MTRNKDIQAIIFDSRPMNPWLSRWLERFEHVRLTSTASPDEFGGRDFLASKRNRILKWFLDETRLPWVLLLDDDIVPLDGLEDCPGTWPLVESQADITSARFVNKGGHEAHRAEGDLAMAAVKISRRALERIAPPWSHFDFTEDGVNLTHCECDYLADRARAAGFCPVKAGAVGHLATAVLIPGRNEKEMSRVKLLSQLHDRAPAPPKPAVPEKNK